LICGEPAAPLVAAVQCPNLASPQSYQFLTIPGALVDSSTGEQAATWDPTTDTAYGSVDISSSRSAVTFNNIRQYTLASVGGTGAPAQPPASSITGLCAPTVLGSTISVPGQQIITTPGTGTHVPPQAVAATGPTGLLGEHNGAGDDPASTLSGTSPALYYNNVLGAGTGTVGLPKSSSALNSGALLSAQYLASFSFSSVLSSCAAVAASTGTLIYGGDFTNDDPSTSASGFGNCDLAIDVGTQDPSNNGLFPKATVWLGASCAANATSKAYSFPAVAIAGQLNGKYAIFLLGVDSSQPWAIYLLQSN
jgi:hypothetical protein